MGASASAQVDADVAVVRIDCCRGRRRVYLLPRDAPVYEAVRARRLPACPARTSLLRACAGTVAIFRPGPGRLLSHVRAGRVLAPAECAELGASLERDRYLAADVTGLLCARDLECCSGARGRSLLT